MTDIEHAKKYAEESISLAISMYNPKAEIIAETACLYGLTYKNGQLSKAKEIIKKIDDIFYSGENAIKRLSKISDILAEAEQFLKEE